MGQPARANVDKALSLAHAALGVPLVLSSDDLCSEGDVDHRSVAMWAAELWHAASVLIREGGGGVKSTAPFEANHLTPRGSSESHRRPDHHDDEGSPHRGRARGPVARMAAHIGPPELITLLHPDGSLLELHATIQGAIDAAGEGCTVSVPEGVYVEELVCSKTVGIVAQSEGDAHAACVVSVTQVPALRVTAKGVFVVGMSLEQADEWRAQPPGAAEGGEVGAGGQAVLVEAGGELEMERCKLSSSRGVCAKATGPGTVLSLDKCRVQGGAEGGVVFEEQSRGSMQDCDVAFNHVFGVLITGGACPSISGTLVHDGLGEGVVFLGDESRGALVSCQVDPTFQPQTMNPQP